MDTVLLFFRLLSLFLSVSNSESESVSESDGIGSLPNLYVSTFILYVIFNFIVTHSVASYPIYCYTLIILTT